MSPSSWAGIQILTGADLQAEPGELVGLVGPNGSGKSTLLRCVYRVLRPHAGSVTLDGDDVWELAAKEAARRTAVVVQEPPAEFDFSVYEIVLMGRSPHKRLLERDTVADAEIVGHALEQVGMAALSERSFANLSGGEKQRVRVPGPRRTPLPPHDRQASPRLLPTPAQPGTERGHALTACAPTQAQ